MKEFTPTISGELPSVDIGRAAPRVPVDFYDVTKRVFDVCFALVAVVLCLPLWALIAVVIKLESRGPVLFKQQRPGRWGEPITVLKFRTMVMDAPEKLEELLKARGQQTQTLVQIPDDPRITRTGRILRKTKLDETPQFLNVLYGDMSVVGPRPISRPIHDSRNAKRLSVLPGITGWWQVNNDSTRDVDFLLEKDMEYLERRSFTFDLLIMWMTGWSVIRRTEAMSKLSRVATMVKVSPAAARTIAIVMLAATVAWAQYERRVIPATSIELGNVPQQAGEWTCVDEAFDTKYGIESKMLTRKYSGPNGAEADVIFQGTYTRLGSLRDWSLARSTGGWAIPREVTRPLVLAGSAEKTSVRLQELSKDGNTLMVVAWYTSPDRDAVSLSKAEMAAWTDRLVGRKAPWLSMYITVPVSDELDKEQAETSALQLAEHLAPAMRAVAASSTP